MSPDARGGKSLSLMSGGERTFIDACLTRAIALYLAQNTGRRFDTLFSDEADGPLDPDHKRMFMAMKREVLRLADAGTHGDGGQGHRPRQLRVGAGGGDVIGARGGEEMARLPLRCVFQPIVDGVSG